MHDSCASINLSNLYVLVGFVKSYENRPDIGTISYTNVAYRHKDDDCRGGSGCNVGWDCISCVQVNTSWRQKILNKLGRSTITFNLFKIRQLSIQFIERKKEMLFHKG